VQVMLNFFHVELEIFSRSAQGLSETRRWLECSGTSQ
jgi:hypothetical protein